MFFGRKENKDTKPIPKKGMLYMCVCNDGYIYAPFSEKLDEEFEEITEELFLEKTKDLYYDNTEYGSSIMPVLQLATEDNYGIVICSNKIGDESKVKVPTANQLKTVADIANAALKIAEDNLKQLENENEDLKSRIADLEKKQQKQE